MGDGASDDVFEFFAEPGWYTIDYKRNVQAFWDGAMWSRTRRWRGVGWFEDDTASVLEPAVGVDVLARYGPASVVAAAAGRSARPPSLLRVGDALALPPAPVVPRFNGMAVGSLRPLALRTARRRLRARDHLRLPGPPRHPPFPSGPSGGIVWPWPGSSWGSARWRCSSWPWPSAIVALARMTSRMTSAIDNSAAVGVPAQLSSQALQTAERQCQADLRTVDVAVTAYRTEHGGVSRAADWPGLRRPTGRTTPT